MTTPKLIFIVPYRNRIFLKNHFDIYMQYILEDLPKDSYKIYFSHQKDARPFNRGGVKNIGFIAMRDLYPNDYKDITFVFNDIDTMPAKKNHLNYETTHGVVKHFYGFEFALGGIFSIKGGDFEKIGGFPNFWAWGLEDNDIKGRVDRHNLTIDRSQFHPYADARIIHIPYNYKRILSKQQSWRAGPNCVEGFNDIKNLKYSINDEFIDITAFTTKVDPGKDHYFEFPLTGKIHRDPKFIPPDAVKGVNTKFGNRKFNFNQGENKSKFSLF